MNVLVIGTGYVGLTSAVALAYIGHEVVCHDTNPTVIEKLQAGQVHIYEPGLETVLASAKSRIRFTDSLDRNDLDADVILICVGTPSMPDGSVDVRYVHQCAVTIGQRLPEGATPVIVNKSTVPVGTAQMVQLTVGRLLAERGIRPTFTIASNPEFLREGSALMDTFCTDRILVGSPHPEAVARLKQLYGSILEQTFAPVPGVVAPNPMKKPVFIAVKAESSELAKYAANTFLAMKISYANEIGGVAERVGADIKEVMQAVGLDDRIGPRFLGAGVGWGGSCFGKDIRGLMSLAGQYGYEMPLAKAAVAVNDRQRRAIVDKLVQLVKVLRGRTVAVWGLTFKPNTDDLRDTPALGIISQLLDMGADVRVYDPVGMERTRELYPDLRVTHTTSPLDAARGADAVVLVTEWDEFLKTDWACIREVVRGLVVVDGRNALDAAAIHANGFTYVGVGR